ncbi:YycH family regulatory protein [Vagococcus fluvialis]|uniref:YycH family regulatory protein n=1 Tax=Vagococcus fluvialis TaxID=2738 RepID=UPI003B59C0FE
MNQLLDKVIKVSLVTMILLSLFLSWKIWTKPANRSLAEKDKNSGEELVHSKKMTDVYVPTKLFYHESKDEYLYSNKESMILDIHHKVTGFNFNNGKEMNQKEIEEIIYAGDAFNLLFPEEYPLSVYEDIYDLTLDIPSEMKDMMFNRIIFSLKDDKIYFVNHQLDKGISYDVEGDSKSIESILKDKKKANYLPVSLTPENIAGIYYLVDDVELKTYSYILAPQSFTTFTKAFFNQPNDLYSNESDNVNVSNGEGESLTIQSATGEVTYFGKLKKGKDRGNNSLYYDTFQYVENLGNTLGTLRYFDSKEGDIIYRNYIEGYPVFGQDMKGRLEVGVKNKSVFVRTNQETIQIPIPSEETVSLIPTEELMANLVAAGVDLSKVDDVQIAYEWQANAETKQVVDLVPTWYVKFEDAWYPATVLMEQGGAK